MVLKAVEDEIERLDQTILAAENWSHLYSKTPDIHAKLIKADTRLERKLRKHFRTLASKAAHYVNWNAYQMTIQAYSIDVIVNTTELANDNGELVKIIFDDIAYIVSLGAQSGEELYNRVLGLSSSDAVIQKVAREEVAKLVGMRLDKNGTLIKNPNAEYNITETVRDDIRSSVQSSISLGEDIKSATKRLEDVISNPKRAETIARTETVNSFGQGLLEFGRQSEAVGKEWQDTGADDECADNTAEGIIDIDGSFGSGDDSPAAHPNCRCSMRLVYANELDGGSGSSDSNDEE